MFDGRSQVMLPEMILAHLADMLSGKAKKNPGVAMRAAKAGEKEQPKARKGACASGVECGRSHVFGRRPRVRCMCTHMQESGRNGFSTG